MDRARARNARERAPPPVICVVCIPDDLTGPSGAGRRFLPAPIPIGAVGLRRETAAPLRALCAMKSLFLLPHSSLVTRHSSLATRHFPSLLSRFTRKCARQRKRGYVTRGAVRFLGIVSEVFLNRANDLDHAHSTGHAGQPVPSRDTQQLIMHQEAIGEAFHPAQAGCITVDAGSVSVPSTVYA